MIGLSWWTMAMQFLFRQNVDNHLVVILFGFKSLISLCSSTETLLSFLVYGLLYTSSAFALFHNFKILVNI